ncbi:MAG: hypothetical protein LT070_03735 [Solirubrobacteraceae bacterium]|nr:hypothetical protein [Solirubrobacteraceae bacterium]
MPPEAAPSQERPGESPRPGEPPAPTTPPASGEPPAPTTYGAPRARPARGEGRLVAAALLAAGLVLSGLTILNGIQVNDEGLMLQAAARIAAGEVPYRDFWWFYPPGQPYLLGGLWAALGPSLLWWRVVRLLADAVVALLAWRLARRRAGPWPSLVVWAVSICAMAFPSGPHPFPLALAFALGALLLFEHRPAWAGLLAGLCLAWRIEFAAYLVAGIALALAVGPGAATATPAGNPGGRDAGSPEPGRVADRGARRRIAIRFLLAGGATGLALYLPVVLRAGLATSWDLLVRYPLEDFSRYQGLPFPRRYEGPLSDVAGGLLPYYLPLALVVGLAAALLALALRFRRERDWPVLATALFTVGMAHYLVVRPDYFHAAPLAVGGSVLFAWAIATVRGGRLATDARGTLAAHAAEEPRGILAGFTTRLRATLATPTAGPRCTLAALAAGLAALSLAYALAQGVSRRWLQVHERTVPLDAAVADGVRAAPATGRPLAAAVAELRRLVPSGRPIYVIGRRADWTTAGAPLVYVLAGRPNPTRYDIAAPGVVTSLPVQREIVADLKRARPGAIVRWTDPVSAAPEPNLAGRPSGVRLLDEWIARSYREAARYGAWTVLVPRVAAGA